MEVSLKNRSLLNIAIILFSCLIGYRDITNTTMSGIYIAAIAISIVLSLPYDKGVKFTFFLLPFTCGIPGYTILGISLVLLAKSKHFCIEQILPPIIFGLAEFAHSVFYDFSVSYSIIMSFTSFVFIFFYLLFDRNEVNRIDCIRMFIYGAIITMLIIYSKILIENSIEDLMSGSLRSGAVMGLEDNAELEIGFLGMNANTIGLYSLVVYTLLLIMGRKLLNISTPLYTILLTLSLVAGFLSFSRTWIISASVATIAYILTLRHNKSYNSIIMLVLVVAIIAQTSIIDTGFDVFLERFSSDEDGGGRMDIFELYHNFWLSDAKTFLLGTGTTYSMQAAGGILATHNSIQQLYLGFGLVGIMLFVGIMTIFFRRFTTANTPFAYYIPIIACFLFSQSIQFWYPSFLVFPYVAAAYALRLPKDVLLKR